MPVEKQTRATGNEGASWIIWLVLALPFVGYLAVVNHYVVNIPFWDDYVSILMPLSDFLTHADWHDRLTTLYGLHNGLHPFVVQRLLCLLWVKLGGGINFAQFLLLSNIGWGLTAAALVYFFWRQCAVPLRFLLPIPFFMLSTSHWEAMDFSTSAFQYYWGGGVFAVGCLIAAYHGRGILAGVFLALAMSSFGGAYALIPESLLMFIVLKRWKALALHVVTVAVLVAPRYYVNGFNLNHGDGAFPPFFGILHYLLLFVGNFFSIGQYDSSSLNPLVFATGFAVLGGSAFALWKYRLHPQYLLPAMLILYVVLLGVMTALVRFDIKLMPPRYSMYALLAGAALYGWLMTAFVHQKSPGFTKRFSLLLSVVAVGYWAQTVYVTRIPLAQNHDQRYESLRSYEHGDTAAIRAICMLPNTDEVLQRAKKLGVYSPDTLP